MIRLCPFPLAQNDQDIKPASDKMTTYEAKLQTGLSKLEHGLEPSIMCDVLADYAVLRKQTELEHGLDSSCEDDDRFQAGADAEDKSPFLLALDEASRDGMDEDILRFIRNTSATYNDLDP